MEVVLALIGVVILAVAGDAYERHCVRRINKKMDKVMGRDD